MPNLRESKELDKMRSITSLSMTEDEKRISKSPTKELRESILDRMPKGWK